MVIMLAGLADHRAVPLQDGFAAPRASRHVWQVRYSVDVQVHALGVQLRDVVRLRCYMGGDTRWRHRKAGHSVTPRHLHRASPCHAEQDGMTPGAALIVR
jgi:hypothetical protein